jgi:hypothetical protein
MSNTQFVFLEKSKVPTRESLQDSIDALNFDLKLYPKLDLLNDSGFSPCIFYGTPDVGFELYSGSVRELVGINEALLKAIGKSDVFLSLVWQSSLQDLAAAMIVSCALAHDFGAVVSYEGNPPTLLGDLLEVVPQIVAEARAEH